MDESTYQGEWHNFKWQLNDFAQSKIEKSFLKTEEQRNEKVTEEEQRNEKVTDRQTEKLKGDRGTE